MTADNTKKFTDEATKRVEESTERAKEFASAVTESTKTNSALVIDNYEQAAKSFFEAQRDLAESQQVDWVKDASATQIQFAEEVTNAWVKAARQLLN